MTYVLGAVAGFFTFGGIGLISKGYQLEGGITLVIGLLSLVQFIRFLKEEYYMKSNRSFVWYACYGSNLSKQRFDCYIVGDTPKYGNTPNDGCLKDKTIPTEDYPYIIPYRLYFALPNGLKKTPRWGNGGVAFIEPNEEKNKDHWTKGRIWKITEEQYKEVRRQEGKTWYDKEIILDDRDGIPIITITNSNILTNVLQPSKSYLKTIIEGLMETYDMDDDAIVSYLIEKEGIINKYTKNQLMTVAQSVH